MARCPNKNTAEYKVLQNVYKTEIATNNVINQWQDLNNVDIFPTVLEASDFVSNQKLLFALKQRKFSESLLNNLRRERIGHSFQNQFYVNNSNPNTQEYDEFYLNSNLKRLKRYLSINNIPENRVTIERTAQSYRVTVNEDMFTTKDMIESSRAWDTPRARAVVMHLKRMFPQVNVQMLSVSDAKAMYNEMPSWKKSNVPFDKVRSFYVDGTAYLIKGRVTNEVAIEEMLHPFIDAIKVDNQTLFDNLLAEARINFPEMVQEITDSYNKERRFSETDRNLEIVTQALARHFREEYETTPTRRFSDLIRDALEWFMNVINNLNQYLTGREVPVSAINSNTNFTDLAKLLNTEGIEFKLDSRVNGKIRYNLSPQKKKALEIQRNSANGVQKIILDKMFHVAQTIGIDVDFLSANLKDTSDGSIVILNEKDHTYYNINTGEVYTSVTTAIKGKLKNQEDVQLNLDLGNDVDALLDAIIAGEALDTVSLSLLTPEIANQVYNQLESSLKFLMPEDSIALSQVVLFDDATKTAGTVDLMIIDKNGKVRILDLKTSKNSIQSKYFRPTKGGSLRLKKYDKSWDLSAESLLYQKGVQSLSTREQHNLQVNIYRRMAENMGYQVYEGDYAAATIHFVADITGKGKDQKFNGNIKADGIVDHPPSQNLDMVNMIVPQSLDAENKTKKLEEAYADQYNAPFVAEDQFKKDKEQADNIDLNDYPEYNTILGALESYRIGLIKKRDAMDSVRSSVFMDRSEKDMREDIASHLAYIGIAIAEGPLSQSQAYSALLRDALKQINTFTEYVENPDNYAKSEFITYVNNFDRFIKTFEGLYSVKESGELNATQRSLLLSLQLSLNKLAGSQTDGTGIINEAVSNFVTETVRLKANNDYGGVGSAFSEQDLIDLIEGNNVKDIDTVDLQTRDMATSPKVLLAVMDKIFKAKKQRLLDNIGQRNEIISRLANKVLKLSPTDDRQKIYDFMHESDGRYVKPIGKQYYDLQDELRGVLYDNDGHPFLYNDITDLDSASQEDINHNIKLANNKRAFSQFFAAEVKDEDGNLVDGMYHRYTPEFKEERKKYEYWTPGTENNPYGTWRRKNSRNISDKEYSIYEAKYYNTIDYTKAQRNSLGDPTGAVVRGQTFRAVKEQYRDVRLETADGRDMASAKYRSIMNPTDALGQAQKEFYEMYIDVFEKDLLNKLPVGVMTQMVGRTPLVKNNFINDLKKRPSFFSRAYAKTIGSDAWKIFQTTSQQRGIVTDENGNLISSLPVYYVGRPRQEGELENVQKEILTLKDKKRKSLINATVYAKELADLKGKESRLLNQPATNEISRDLGESLMKFSAMAENYEVMGTIEDTLNAFIKVIEKREYQPADPTITTGTRVDGAFQKRGIIKGADSNVLRKAKKWMSMTYYQEDTMSKGAVDKISDGLIQLSSLSYVAFNPFGNFNNYVIGRINNNIEMLGSRFFSKKAYRRATWEFNKRAVPDLVQRSSYVVGDLGDVLTFGTIKGLQNSTYDAKKPNSKYEAFVDMFRMMDKMSDLREQTSDTSTGRSWFAKASEWGYILQDAAEYNVQTKVGMAILMDTQLKNSETGETLSLYDAFVYDSKTHKNKIKDGFNTVIKRNGQEIPYTDEFRYEIRNEIREVNKQIHGNYAKEDRVVMQSTTIGKLAFQFHKWVAPAIRARYQREYFDQNLGWMEGRYISAFKFLAYVKSELVKGNKEFSKYDKGFLEAYGYTGEGGNLDQRATNKLYGFYRTMGEIGIMLSTFVLSQVLSSLLAGEDDDSETTKRFKNIIRYQADRTYKELVMFTPLPDGLEQQYQMFKSPIAATRTMGELGEALSLTITTPMAYLYYSDEEFRTNSNYVYQQKPRKGQLKVYKNWKDVVPILYSIQKYDAYLRMNNYFIK